MLATQPHAAAMARHHRRVWRAEGSCPSNLPVSGGQRQRTALARAILPEPVILILDDTTSAVDTETERQIEASLRRVMAGRTTFVVSHRVSAVCSADEILVLDRGRIAERGTHDELVARGGIYARMVGVQTGSVEGLADCGLQTSAHLQWAVSAEGEDPNP